MKNKIFPFLVFASFLTLLPHSSLAQEVGGDLSIESIQSKEAVIAGKEVRLYATVKNNSGQDLLGTVKFYDETKGSFVGLDQPVSIVGNGTDEVFVDWMAEALGDKSISARVIPWENEGDDSNNNKITTTIYVDVDSDGDGQPNREDPDDDNDGTNDDTDTFPEDPTETKDTDGDGIGNNADEDDDNDNVPDVKDVFPEDSKESLDTDKDKVGDNADVFPQDPKEAVDQDGDGIGQNTDVDDKNLGPIPKITVEDTVLMIGRSVTLDASQSKDSDGEIKLYEWVFTDGSKATGEKVEKEFGKAGNYKVTLKVSDDKGESRKSEITLTVIHRWQSLPFVISFIAIVGMLIGYGLYFLKKNKTKKKNLPRNQK